MLSMISAALVGCASDDAPASSRLESGLMRLGASPERSKCLAGRIGDDRAAKRAARLVEKSSGREDLRDRVLGADVKTRRAFIAANLGCPRGQDGA